MTDGSHDIETEMVDLSGFGLADLSISEVSITAGVLDRILADRPDLPDPLLGGPLPTERATGPF